MSAAAVRAGRALVEIIGDDKGLQQALSRAQGRLRAFEATTAKIGARLVAFGAVSVAAFGLTIKAASNMQEVMNKFDVVFAQNSQKMKEWGDEFAAQVGRSKRQAAEYLAGAQDLLVPIGFEAGAAAEMSKQLTTLAVDLASFNNRADDDVMRDLQAALTGSGEVMKKYGVIVSEAAVKQELLSKGLDPNAVDDQAKVLARMSIIMRGTTAAQGDAIRSAGSFANQLKRLRANTEDAAAKIGETLLPVVTPLVTRVAQLVEGFGQWAAQNTGLVVTLAQVAGGALALGVALLTLSKAAGLAATSLGTLKTSWAWVLANPIVAGVAAAAVAFTALAISIKRASEYHATLNSRMEDSMLAGDAVRAADAQRLRRLQQLSEQESLTNQETREAVELAGQLNSSYGDLGIRVDAATGALTGMNGAFERMRDLQRDLADMQISSRMLELAENVRLLEREFDNVENNVGPTWGFINQSEVERAIAVEGASIQDRIAAEQAQLRLLQQRRESLRSGDVGALSGDASASVSFPSGIDLSGSDSDKRAIEEWTRRVHQLRIEQIEDERERAIAALQEKYDHERTLAAENTEALGAIEQARALELQTLERRFEAEKQRRDQEKADRAAEKAADAAERAAELAGDADSRRATSIGELEVRATGKTGAELELELLRLRRAAAIEEAKAAGERLDLVEREYDLREEIASLADAGSDLSRRVTIAGGFDTSRFGSLVGASDVEKEQLTALKTIADEAKSIRRNTGEGLQFA